MPINNNQEAIQNFYNVVVRPQTEAEMAVTKKLLLRNPGPPPCEPKDDFARSLTPEQRGEKRNLYGELPPPPPLDEVIRQARQRLNNIQNMMQNMAPMPQVEPEPIMDWAPRGVVEYVDEQL